MKAFWLLIVFVFILVIGTLVAILIGTNYPKVGLVFPRFTGGLVINTCLMALGGIIILIFHDPSPKKK